VALQLSAPAIPSFAPAIEDIRQQIHHLLPPSFLTDTPDRWLMEIPRFLRAIQLRLDKLSTTGHSRDAQRMAEVQPFWQAYQLQVIGKSLVNTDQMEQFRWMIEEFRVSQFAQELKTSVPISAPRLQKQWALVRK
jgi:ATP-dependent helicase HrpA